MSAPVLSKDEIRRLKSFWEAGMPRLQIAREMGLTVAELLRAVRHPHVKLPPRAESAVVETPKAKPALKSVVPPVARVVAAPPVAEVVSAPVAHPNWSVEQEAAIRASEGRYAEIGKLADAWGIPSTRIIAHWHVLRRQA
ncbi:helix-turn-helix domain-containing protein [Shimia aestuarii]|uniref:helix-turn-helix domain-containing protein n=1 Tax=Shimia aestuarii TaxID=254406 RepID=UPI001FB4A12F|nr:helix-turn-helix domain-containing protein [Shimia aestuarii]